MRKGADPRPIIGGAFDFRGRAVPDYAPKHDLEPDPGEVVWAWVPFEDDPIRGKDRPLAVVGRALDKPSDLVCFQLSSKPRRAGSGWLAIGSGDWDSKHRPTWVKVARPLAVRSEGVRREGGELTREQFEAVIDAAREAFPPHQ